VRKNCLEKVDTFRKPNGLWGTDPLWLADKTASGWSVNLYYNDHLWTPQRLTDTAGTIVWSARSEALGNTQTTVNTIINPLRFPGQYNDSELSMANNYLISPIPQLEKLVAIRSFGSA